MPKKFSGENTKAVAARARKEAAKREEAEKKKKAEEDAYWQDDDKNVTRKQRKVGSFLHFQKFAGSIALAIIKNVGLGEVVEFYLQ